jgi:hypothetical protein
MEQDIKDTAQYRLAGAYNKWQDILMSAPTVSL